jgi:hypothetical protein
MKRIAPRPIVIDDRHLEPRSREVADQDFLGIPCPRRFLLFKPV